MKDKFIYLVTPDYMLAIIEETKAYSFFVKAYPSAHSAYRNLAFTNQNSVLGYLMVYEELPEDLTDIIKFINFLNLIGDKNTVVVLAVNNVDGLQDYLIPELRVDNINFSYISDFEIVTDNFIKQNLIGSIIINKFKPYIEYVPLLNQVTSFNRNKSLEPVLPADILLILSPIAMLDNSNLTIKHDIVLNENRENVLVHYLRINMIYASFGLHIDYKGMLSRINSSSNIDKVIYRVVCNIIKDEYDSKVLAIKKSLNLDIDEKDSVNLPISSKVLVGNR